PILACLNGQASFTDFKKLLTYYSPMATRKSTTKAFSKEKISAKSLNICVVVSQWHKDITDSLLEGVFQVFEKTETEQFSMEIINVPGSYELPLGAELAIK